MLEIFFNFKRSSFTSIKFHLRKQTVSKTAVHILVCIAECSV